MIAALLMTAAVQHWLLVSDVHLDPFSARGIVRGKDTTPVLWRSALAEMHKEVPDARVVLVGGDVLAHHFPSLAARNHVGAEAQALETTRSVARGLGAAFPHAQFLVTLGNNDDPCGDYRSETRGGFEAALAQIWQPLVDRGGAAPDFVRQFERGGYYTARLPIPRTQAIVLNSIFWSIVYRGGCLSRPHAPGATELSWLASALARVGPGERAVVVMPVPANAGRIRWIAAGHTHRYDFRIASGVPVLVGSSISPVYKNNPAFYDLTVDASGRLLDVQPYAYHLLDGRWMREPSFDSMYGTRAFDARSLARVASQIRHDPSVRNVWKKAYDVWSWRVYDLKRDWRPYACAQTELGTGFAACARTSRRTRIAELLLIAAALGAIGLIVVVVRRRARRRR